MKSLLHPQPCSSLLLYTSILSFLPALTLGAALFPGAFEYRFPAIAVPLAVAAAFFLHAFLFRLCERTLPGLALWCLLLIVAAMLPAAALLSRTPPETVLLSAAASPLAFIDRLRLSVAVWNEEQGMKLVDISGVLLTGLLLYAYTAYRLNRTYGLLGSLLFLTTPLVIWCVGSSFRPLLVLYWTTFLLSVLRWNETRRAPWVVLGVLAAGAASLLASQPLLVLALALYFCFLNWIFSSSNMTRLAHKLLLIGVTLAIGFLAAAALQYTAPPVPNTRTATPALFFSWPLPAPESPLSGALGMLLLVFLPWSFKGKWIHEKKSLFVLAGAVLLSFAFYDDLGYEWLLLAAAALVLLAIYGIHNLYLRVKHPWALYGWILALVLWNGARAFSPFVLR